MTNIIYNDCTTMVISVLIILGLCFGSFVNALVWRMHEQQAATNSGKPKSSKSKKSKSLAVNASDMSIVTGRSMCPNCHHLLATRDLIPVLSWISLRGKCRYCNKKYDDTPTAEIATPLLFVFSYLYWPFVWSNMGALLFAIWSVIVVGFVALIIYDIRWRILPNRIVFPLFLLALVYVFLLTAVYGGGLDTILSSFYGLLIGSGIFYAIFQFPGKELIGGGDVKLGAVLGLLVGGPWPALLMLFTASCLGTLFALPSLITGKANWGRKISFGPFLIAATIIVYLFGASIITWYERLIGLG